MKELTIEEKAKAYDEALERAKKAQQYDDCNVCLYIFPELAESEDERIRKEMIFYFTEEIPQCSIQEHADKMKEFIAWLEKQGTSYTKKDVDDAYVEGVAFAKDELKKQYEATYQTRKDIATFIFNYRGDIKDRAKWIDYLGIKVSFAEDQDEQRPTDKVEPKFREGEWITNGDYTWEIVEVKPLDYILQSQDGNIVDDTISYVDKQFHPFTIKDAKDGDVLHSTGLHNDCIFIFNGLDNWKFDEPNGDRAVATGYCCLSVLADKMEFGIQGPDCVEVNTVKPATKEQRDLLFTKMKEAGYKWDAEKKELKLLITNGGDFGFELGNREQKPVLSEEDEHKIKDIVYFLNTAKKHYASTVELDACIEWLKSLKKRVQLQPKQEWNELLEKFRQAVYDCAWGKVTCKPEGETKEEYVNRWTERFLLIVRNWADGYEVKKSNENKIKGK